HRPERKQPLTRDRIHPGVERNLPARRCGRELPPGRDLLATVDEDELAEVEPERIEPQPEVERALVERDRVGEDALRIGLEARDRNLPDERSRKGAGEIPQ